VVAQSLFWEHISGIFVYVTDIIHDQRQSAGIHNSPLITVKKNLFFSFSYLFFTYFNIRATFVKCKKYLINKLQTTADIFGLQAWKATIVASSAWLASVSFFSLAGSSPPIPGSLFLLVDFVLCPSSFDNRSLD
jgi:hypothetical protein